MPVKNVLLLHGIDDTCRVFKYLQPFLEERGFIVHCLNLVPNNGDAPLDELAHQVAAYVNDQLSPSEPFHLVGFSMGGLVARYYVQRLNDAGRVRRLVTISSPHRGTWIAHLRWNHGARQMRPGSKLLRELDQNREALTKVGFTSIWTPLDLMILPADSSILPEARMIRLMVTHHARMIRDPRVMGAVAEALNV